MLLEPWYEQQRRHDVVSFSQPLPPWAVTDGLTVLVERLEYVVPTD
jgi:hypothetical protein